MQVPALPTQGLLTDSQLLAAAEGAADFRILPDATVIKIGGQSVIDRGPRSRLPSLMSAKPTSCLLGPAQAPGRGTSTRLRRGYTIPH
jgi:molybdenum storage protein